MNNHRKIVLIDPPCGFENKFQNFEATTFPLLWMLTSGTYLQETAGNELLIEYLPFPGSRGWQMLLEKPA